MKKKILMLICLIGSMAMASEFKVLSFNLRNSKDSIEKVDGKNNWNTRSFS